MRQAFQIFFNNNLPFFVILLISLSSWTWTGVSADFVVDDTDYDVWYSDGDWLSSGGVEGSFNGTLSQTNGGSVSVTFNAVSQISLQCVQPETPYLFDVFINGNSLVELNTSTSFKSTNAPAGSKLVGSCVTVQIPPANVDQTHNITITVRPPLDVQQATSLFSVDAWNFTSSSTSKTTIPPPNEAPNADSSPLPGAAPISRAAVIFTAIVASLVSVGLIVCLFLYLRKRHRERAELNLESQQQTFASNNSMGGIDKLVEWSFENSTMPAHGDNRDGSRMPSVAIPPKAVVVPPTAGVGAAAGFVNPHTNSRHVRTPSPMSIDPALISKPQMFNDAGGDADSRHSAGQTSFVSSSYTMPRDAPPAPSIAQQMNASNPSLVPAPRPTLTLPPPSMPSFSNIPIPPVPVESQSTLYDAASSRPYSAASVYTSSVRSAAAAVPYSLQPPSSIGYAYSTDSIPQTTSYDPSPLSVSPPQSASSGYYQDSSSLNLRLSQFPVPPLPPPLPPKSAQYAQFTMVYPGDGQLDPLDQGSESALRTGESASDGMGVPPLTREGQGKWV